MRRCVTLVVVLVFAVAGCKKHPTGNVVYFSEDDPRMNAAMDKARSTVNTFIVALKSPKPSQSSFSVKMAFTDGDKTEYMWLTPVNFDGNNFTGTLGNEPERVKNVKVGQKFSIAPSKISDWMYIENGKLVGGYTLRVMRDTLSPAERADFDKSVPFSID